MEQVKTFCKRYRLLFLAAAYLGLFALGVMYLRVPVGIPPEGDDKLTLNGWMYDLHRMPFWQFLLQDLQSRLRYFTFQEVRFFPFHYPSAVDLLFYGSLTSYRLYIIAFTAAAAFLVSRVVKRLGGGNALALAAFAMALALAPIYNEGMYSYYAVPQRALFWGMAAWLCLFPWQRAGHKRWAVAAALLAFISCGTYEIGYTFAVLALPVWCLREHSLRRGLRRTAPVLSGMGVALVFHLISGHGSGGGNSLTLNLPEMARVTVQQMAASIPFLSPYLQQQDCGTISGGDKIWPLLLGLAAGLLLCFVVPRRVKGKMLGGIVALGFALWFLPALLLSASARYQVPEAITWKWGYIPAAASSIGMALCLGALVALLASACRKLPNVLSVLLRLVLTAALGLALCANGAYTRGCVRTHHAENLAKYQFFARSIEAGLADAVQPGDLILCNENVWDTNTAAETNFFRRFTGRNLNAQMLGIPVPEDVSGTVYAYQTYRGYGGYDLAWCGPLQAGSTELMDTVQIYVQSAYVPDNAVIKYKVRLPDGTEEARAICLLDCTQTPRDVNGDYLATVEDTSILNEKLMIWDG